MRDYPLEHHSDCDRLIVSYDLVHDEGEDVYRELLEQLSPWEGRLRVIPGNHDSRMPMQKVFGDILRDDPESASFIDEVGGWTLRLAWIR